MTDSWKLYTLHNFVARVSKPSVDLYAKMLQLVLFGSVKLLFTTILSKMYTSKATGNSTFLILDSEFPW